MFSDYVKGALNVFIHFGGAERWYFVSKRQNNELFHSIYKIYPNYTLKTLDKLNIKPKLIVIIFKFYSVVFIEISRKKNPLKKVTIKAKFTLK